MGKLKSIDLFAGIDGIGLAFEKARHTVVWANYIDKYTLSKADILRNTAPKFSVKLWNKSKISRRIIKF